MDLQEIRSGGLNWIDHAHDMGSDVVLWTHKLNSGSRKMLGIWLLEKRLAFQAGLFCTMLVICVHRTCDRPMFRPRKGTHQCRQKKYSESHNQNNLSPTGLNGTVILRLLSRWGGLGSLICTKTQQQPWEIADIRTGVLLTRKPGLRELTQSNQMDLPEAS